MPHSTQVIWTQQSKQPKVHTKHPTNKVWPAQLPQVNRNKIKTKTAKTLDKQPKQTSKRVNISKQTNQIKRINKTQSKATPNALFKPNKKETNSHTSHQSTPNPHTELAP